MSELVRQTELLKDVSGVIFEEASGYRDVPHYVYNLGLIYRRYSWWGIISDFVRKIDPIDAVGRTDPEKAATNSFLKGVLVGIRVAHQARNADYLEIMAQTLHHTDFESVLKGAENSRQRQDLFIQNVKGMGHLGLTAGDPNSRIIETWESQINPDITTQDFVSDGFGFSLYVSHEVGRILARSTMFQQVQDIETGALDWDNGWSELGNNA